MRHQENLETLAKQRQNDLLTLSNEQLLMYALAEVLFVRQSTDPKILALESELRRRSVNPTL